MKFYILRIQLPSLSGSDDRIQSTHIAGFTLPYAYIIEMHILDVERRMLCLVLLCPSSQMLYLHVVFDWDTRESTTLETGFGYVRIFSLEYLPFAIILIVIETAIQENIGEHSSF